MFLKDRQVRRERAFLRLTKIKQNTPNMVSSVPSLTPNEEENASTSKEQDKRSTEEPKGMSIDGAAINPNKC